MTRLIHRVTALFLAVIAAPLMAACGGTRANPVAPSVRAEPGSGAFAESASPAPIVAWSCLTTPGCVVPTVAGGARTVLALTAPGTPINLSSSVSGSTVTLTWTAPATGDAATSYRLEAGSSSGASDLANSDTGGAATTFIATGVPNGTYYVRVRAQNGGGRSDPSNQVVVTVGAGDCTPLAPTLTAAFAGPGAALNWTAGGSCGPTSYEINAGSSAGASNLAVFNTGNANTFYNVATLANGMYYVRVRAVRNANLSAPSNEVVITKGTTTPTFGPLNGGWNGSPPNGGWLIPPSPGVCVTQRFVILQLTHIGNTLTGTLDERYAESTPAGCAAFGSAFLLPVTGTAGTGTLTFTFTDEKNRLITFTGTYTTTRVTGTLDASGASAGTLTLDRPQ
jgi:hypothetical protein